MIDKFTMQVSFLIFEAVFCFLSALVYSVSRDTLRIRKSVVLSLNISCGAMLICEYLFYVYKGSTNPVNVVIMHVVNAAVYYLIVLLMLFYAMLVAIRLFGRFHLKKDMPCRKRFMATCGIVVLGLVLVTVSQVNGMYYYFDENNLYQRGPLFWLSSLIPMIGAFLVTSIIVQYRERISRSQLLVMISYLVLPLAGGILQWIFYGNSYLNICIGLSVLLIFFENMIYKEKEVIKASRTEVRTGLANEHGCVEWLNSMRGKEDLLGFAVVFFDLRKFSEVNRKYGIENGNRILAAFGNIMQSKVGKDEILGRQFGDQFVAIVRKENLEGLLNVLKGVEVSFDDVSTGKKAQVTLTARAGVYMIDRTDLAGEDVLIFAGQALSDAKSKGNADVFKLTQDIIDAMVDRKKLENDVRAGLESGEFIPYYQPKINIKTGRLCGAEALSRWSHGGTILFPGKYVPLMESNDMIRLLDFCILESVCKDIAKWLEDGMAVPMISVNFSRRNLIDPDLAKHIDSVVTKAGIPKNLIEIEVTESSDEFSIGVLSTFVEQLHELGYKVSIDDFGSASSSLALLREVSFDTLKIDKGFVNHAKSKDLTILTHIVRISDEINVDVVAEGVEQAVQVKTLDGLGVDVIQGFYFDKPLPKEEMTKRLKAPVYTL
ncbi:MAG: bifunctional diguanylate cyclase/phosphodiesterase [Lachnospiraceae bacterium]|nr:bifunctional diguanylate cyclase/phosphodiesterase [Lachnospiraceae bacterium]